jgi:putative addiction module component (TIGR02574 family)
MMAIKQRDTGAGMTTAIEDVLAMTKDMALPERAQLAELLLVSLDEPSETEAESLWVEEARRRLADYRAGKSQASDADEVFRRAIADLS